MEDDLSRENGARRLLVAARNLSGADEVEFVSAFEGENTADRLAYMGDTPSDASDGREFSFRLLRHYASSARHQKHYA